jgi:hypothetical protein
MCGRVRLTSDYSEIKIRLKFAPDAPAPNYEADYNKPPTMGRGPMMHANVGIARVVYGPKKLPEPQPTKERHWGRRKLARDR